MNTIIFSKKDKEENSKNEIYFYLPIEIQRYVLDFIFERYKEENVLKLVCKEWRNKIKEYNEKTWIL